MAINSKNSIKTKTWDTSYNKQKYYVHPSQNEKFFAPGRRQL